MIQSKYDYLKALERELGGHPNADELLQEFELHISEMIEELRLSERMDEVAALQVIVQRVGQPATVALLYHQELEITPQKTQWTFILFNLLFFIGGISLTIFYHVVPIPFIKELWQALTSIPSTLMILYMVFWGLLGYEIGKEFGLGGKRLLVRTFYFSLIPNLILMALVVFRIVPFSWFDPLLTPSFIISCIVSTMFLYPISYLGYRWGTSRSI